MRTFKTLALFALLALAACGDGGSGRTENIFNRVFRLTDTDVTTKGVRVRREPGTNISQEAKDAIDVGIDRIIAKSECVYQRSLAHGDYIVAWMHGEPDSQGDPAYRLPCGPYCNTEWDKGGYILVAGQQIAAGTPYGNIMAIPEHRDRFAHLELITEYEGEHIDLAWFDGAKYDATKVHGAGMGHPIYSCPSLAPRPPPSSIRFGDALGQAQ